MKNIEEMARLMRTAADVEILPRWRNVTARDKKNSVMPKDYVTAADTGASLYILERIRKKFPGSYSEEHKHMDRFQNKLLWQIDPVDGTLEFCEGIAEGYASQAALLEQQANGKWFPVAGIIYSAGINQMCYSNGKEIVFEEEGKIVRLPEPHRSEIRGYIRYVEPSSKLANFYRTLGKLGLETTTVSGGGVGSAIMSLLKDKINLIVFNYDYTKEWDVAMILPIIKSRGGFICDFDGNEFVEFNRQDTPGLGEPYNLKGFVVSQAFRKEEILPVLQKNPGLLEKKLTY